MSMKVSGIAFIAMTGAVLAGCAKTAAHGGAALSSGTSLPNAVASTGSPTPTDDANRARADAVTAIAEKLLASVQVPPGSAPIAAPTTGPLAGPSGWPGSDNLIDVSALWKTSGSMDSVLAYVRAHAPSGLTLNGSTSGGSGAMESLSYTGGSAGPLDQGADLLITEAPDPAGGVDMRVDVQDIWRPVRTSAETVPTSVTGATIALTIEQTTKTLSADAATAQHIAGLLNALPTVANFVTKGPAPTTWKTITFTVNALPVVFKSDDELNVISVTVGGQDQPLLADAAPVLTYLDGLFGVADASTPASSPSTSG